MSMTAQETLAVVAETYARLAPKIQRAVEEFEFGTGFASVLDESSGSPHFEVATLVSWIVVFLILYALFALMWRLMPSTGLSTGRLPFIASSRCIGTVHCALVVPLSVIALNRQTSNWLELEYLGLNTPLEQRILEISSGYFLADFVHFALFEPDFLMFFHHVFSTAMMTSAGVIGRGASAATAGLVQGEITNPFQSAWTVARAAKSQSMLAWLSPLFTVVFVLARVLLVPLWTGMINLNFWVLSPNRSQMPFGVMEVWSGMSVLMVVAGWAWSYSLVQGLRKFYKKQAKENGKKTQ